MKRTRTLASYFSRVPVTEVDESPPPLPTPNQETEQNIPPLASSEPEHETQPSHATNAPTAETQPIQHEPPSEEETRSNRASVPATEVSQTPLEQGVEEGGNSNHVLDPEDIIADPGLRKDIEEFDPNVRDDARREYVLLGPCQPKGHKYPVKKIYGKNRSFHEHWYKNRAWLEYSVSKDAAFCFYCYLFKPLRVDNFGVESFTKIGFTNWKDGPSLLDDHANSIAHNKARLDYENYKNQRQSVTHTMDKGEKKGEEVYKGRMIIILGVVRFLLLQAHAFRGHDESAKSSNKGNFLEMIEWYKGRDENAAQLLGIAGKNHTMTSPKIQKDLCKACGVQTAKAIVKEIGDRYFAILVDEARDASIKEQMALIVRYVNAQGQVIERFLGIKNVADTTSSALKEALDVNASCKRRDQLSQQHHDNIVNQLDSGKLFSGRGKNQETNLVRPGDTRWGSHHKTLCRLEHMWNAVLEVLENISEDGVGEKRTTVSGLLLQMESFEFVFILHLMIQLLGITNDLSQCLQRKDQNIVRAVALIGITLDKINDVREHGWDELLEEVNDFSVIHQIVIPNMEDKLTVRGRSRGRRGQQVTYYHHFKNEIFNVVHDQVIVEFNNRFAERSTQLLRCIACLDPKNSFANYDCDKLIELAEIYDADFSYYERRNLRRQLGHFISDVRADRGFIDCTDLGDLAIKMVKSEMHITYSLVYRLVELALVLPVATATVERAFSAMKLIKTELRNKMDDEWLNHRMICYIERGVFASLSNDVILHHFQELKSRKKKLPKLPSSTTCGTSTIDEEMEDVNATNPL